jgi:hypothetical protein
MQKRGISSVYERKKKAEVEEEDHERTGDSSRFLTCSLSSNFSVLAHFRSGLSFAESAPPKAGPRVESDPDPCPPRFFKSGPC